MKNGTALWAALTALALLAGGAGAMDRPDSWITTKVKAELAAHKSVSAIHTKVETNNGIVTLSGMVRSAAEKELAERYARDVEGVQSVDNRLTVASESGTSEQTLEQQRGPGSRALDKVDDASITARVKAALAGDRATSMLQTQVETMDGAVTLTGTADNQAEKDLAERLAKGVKGVKSVDNQIEVK